MPTKTDKADKTNKAGKATAHAPAARAPGRASTRDASARKEGRPATGADAAPSTRSLWRGAISFGLVHIPVGLYTATADSDVDFNWLDRRSMEPVGYKRINKVTGQDIAAQDIVKGVQVSEGRYVVLSEQEIAAAMPKATQTIEIEAFIDADEIPFVYLERPYYTAPLERGEKVYALLREALRQSNKVAVGKVVIHTRQHLAVLIACGRALVLNLLRWGGEIRPAEALELPPAGTEAVGIRSAEMKMALQLVEEMTQPWNADQFRNSFADELRHLVRAKAEAGDSALVPAGPAGAQEQAPADADVADLAALLRRSLGGAPSPSPSLAAAPDAPDKAASQRQAR